MKVCLSVYNKRITTLFENTCLFQIYTYDKVNHRLVEAGEILLSKNCSQIARIYALITAQIDILICGGLSNNCKKMFSNYGIQVFDWICGDSEQVLGAWKKELLQNYLMPGCS